MTHRHAHTDPSMGIPSLSDAEWAELLHYALIVHKAQGHEIMRHQALEFLSHITPFDVAAFFLVEESRTRLGECMIAQPLGIDVSAEEFKRLFDEEWKHATAPKKDTDNETLILKKDDTLPSVAGRCPLSEAHDTSSGILCVLFGESGPLGALMLTRNRNRPYFTQRDIAILGALGPHWALQLEKAYEKGQYQALCGAEIKEAYGVSRREIDVISCILYGMTIPEIGIKLAISPHTARKHLENIYRKTGVNNRVSLMKLAQRYLDK